MGDGVTLATQPTLLVGRRGMSFDGGDYINTGLLAPTRMTVGGVVTMSSVAASPTLFSNYGPGDTGFIIYYGGGEFFHFLIINSGANQMQQRAAYASGSLKGPHSVIVTYDGSGVPGGMLIYVDGVQMTTTPTSAGSAPGLNNGRPIILGAADTVGTQPLTGTMLSHALFPFALTPSQVAILSTRLLREARLD